MPNIIIFYPKYVHLSLSVCIERIIHGDNVINISYYLIMSDNKSIETIANTLISQYGDDAEAVAMLRAAEYAADLNNEEWIKWENIIKKIHSMNAVSYTHLTLPTTGSV